MPDRWEAGKSRVWRPGGAQPVAHGARGGRHVQDAPLAQAEAPCEGQ